MTARCGNPWGTAAAACAHCSLGGRQTRIFLAIPTQSVLTLHKTTQVAALAYATRLGLLYSAGADGLRELDPTRGEQRHFWATSGAVSALALSHGKILEIRKAGSSASRPGSGGGGGRQATSYTFLCYTAEGASGSGSAVIETC